MANYLISLSLLICAVIIIRAIFRKRTSQRLIYAMWLLVVIRMCFPFTLFEVEMPQFVYTAAEQPAESTSPIENIVSTPETSVELPETAPFTEKETEIITDNATENSNSVTDSNFAGNIATPPKDTHTEKFPPQKKEIDISQVLLAIWTAGTAAMSVWFFASWAIFTVKLWNTRIYHSEYKDIKVYVSDKIASPCIAGLKPIIYITKEASQSENLAYVLAHEYTHLHHGDRIWSVLRVIATCFFWWNPLVWTAAFLSKGDAELACDESVSKKYNENEKRIYANSIVDMIPRKSNYAIGFGNGSIKERIIMLTDNRPKKALVSVIAVILAITCVGCAYTVPTQNETNDNKKSELTTNNEHDAHEPSDENIKISGEMEMTVEAFNENLCDWNAVEAPCKNYIVNVTGLSVPLTAEFHDKTVLAKINTYGHTLDINKHTHYTMNLYEFGDAILFAQTDYHVGDTYVITSHGIDELHKGDDFSLSLHVDENQLRYTNTCNKYRYAVQEITAGLSAAAGWDDIYFEEGNAEIKDGKIVLSEPDITVLAKDIFNFQKIYEDLRKAAAYEGSEYYNTIDDLFESNKVYTLENYKDSAAALTEDEQKELDKNIQKKYADGVVSNTDKFYSEEKVTIDGEIFYIVADMYLNNGEWKSGANSLYIVNESLTEMYLAEYTVDGKSIRWTENYNALTNEFNGMVTIPKSDYKGINIIAPVSSEQKGSGKQTNYTNIGYSSVVSSYFYSNHEPGSSALCNIINIQTREELVAFIEEFSPYCNMNDSSNHGTPSFNEISSYYNEEYFKENDLLLLHPDNSCGFKDVEISDIEVGNSVFSAKLNYTYEPYDGEFMGEWLITVEVSKALTADCTEYVITLQ